jgi:hypothetical protein
MLVDLLLLLVHLPASGSDLEVPLLVVDHPGHQADLELDQLEHVAASGAP